MKKMKISGITFDKLFDLLLLFFVAMPPAHSNDLIPCNSSIYNSLMFRCDDGNCILHRQVCDGKANCIDGSDEKSFNESLSPEDWKACTIINSSTPERKCALPKSLVCDSLNHCLEDECGCNNSFSCSANECIPMHYFCDGIVDCINGEDEKPYSSYAEGVKCQFRETSTLETINHSCVLPHTSPQRCDIEHEDCVAGSDECFCNVDENHSYFDEEQFFDSTCFRCLDTMGEAQTKYVCDGYIHCSDLSDECLCENPISICNQLEHNKSDCQILCKQHPGGNFTGNSNETRCIRKNQICDRNRDCFYGEDEKYCPEVSHSRLKAEKITKKENKEFWCCNAGYPADCLYDYTYTNDSYDGCDQFYKCSRPNTYQNYQKYALQCDGIASCTNMGDECNENCEPEIRQLFCQDSVLKFNSCPNTGTIIIPWSVCDGIPDCNPNEPLKSSDEFNCSKRFYCTNIPVHTPVSIDPSKKCDCIEDCHDGTDENNCNDQWSQFCCKTGNEAVSKAMVCDGKDDCSDGSDECQSCIKSPFADDKHLISNKVLRAFIWIIGFASSGGNLHVIYNTIKQFRHSKNKLAKLNSLQVLSLAIADLCVGVYLLGLGIVNAVFADVYCSRDESWRSGQACKSFGVLATFGLQTSVFLMTFISINRLYSIKSKILEHQKIKYSCIVISIIYIVAFIVAIVPILPVTEEYFIATVRFAKNPFLKRTVNRTQLNTFAVQLSQYGKDQKFHNLLGNASNSLYSWQQVFHAMIHLNDTFVPIYKFGYYSAHGVCLPKFFPQRTGNPWTWRYSMFLITVNFLSLFIIFLCYILIYRETKKITLQAIGRQRQQSTLEKRITRIILTDFCCWMPICLTGFLSFGGVPVSNEFYAITAVVILPINSALNPFLYSNLPDKISERVSTAYSSFQSIRVNRSGSTLNSSHEMNALKPDTK